MSIASKEAIVIILDVGIGMTKTMGKSGPTYLEAAIKAINLLVQQKMLFGKHDEIGLVLFGTQETNNQLSADGYENISVVHSITTPDLDLLRLIEKIEPGNAEADIIDALVIGMDLLFRKTEKKKYERRIFLVTDASGPCNQSDVHVVLEQFKKMDARLNVIGVDFGEEEESGSVSLQKSASKLNNELFIKKMVDEVDGVIVPVNQALEMMSYFRSKSVLQRTTFRGLLEINSNLQIPVYSYMKTMEQKFPHLVKVSAVSQQSATPGSMAVLLERTYHSITNPDEEIPSSERIKGYKYGKNWIPFSKIDEATLKYSSPERCLKAIGFTSSKNVPRWHYMGPTEIVVSDPRDSEASVALSALIRALAETEAVIIVRYVKKKGSAPQLGCLTPQIKSEYDCLYYHKLPFSEDLRQYPFPSLAPERARKQFVPTEEQKLVVDNLIQSLNLMEAAEDEDGNKLEGLKPKYTYNPVLQRLYQCVQHRALKPNAPLPPLDPVIESYINPDKKLFRSAEPALKKFKSMFPLQKSEETKDKIDRIYWRDSMMNKVRLDSYVPDANKKRKMESEYDLSLEDFISSGVEEVGSINPVSDFKEMLSRRDVDLVEKAIDGMKKKILQLVNDSLLNQYYPKAIECLNALRDGCIQEEESETFNNFLRDLRKYFKGKRKNDFWNLIVSKKISLIHYEESDDSSVSPQESKQFLIEQEEEETKPKVSREESIDNLFEMVE